MDADVILPTDKNSFVCWVDRGMAPVELKDKRLQDRMVTVDAYLFDAHFSDGHVITFRVHNEFGSKDEAVGQMSTCLISVGVLPSSLRKSIRIFGILDGEGKSSAGYGNIFMHRNYGEYWDGLNRLEELIFTHTAYLALVPKYDPDKSWREAQAADKGFISDFAQSGNRTQDVAETALAAYAVMRVPYRLSTAERKRVRDTIANRYQFLLEKGFAAGPVFDIPEGGPVTLADTPDGCMAEAPM